MAETRISLHRVDNSFFNVLDFGAANDYSTDASTAINAAIAAAKPSNGTVYFPAGTYKIAGTINWDYRVSLEGNSWTNTILKASAAITMLNNSTNTSVITSAGIYVPSASIRNLQFDGNSIGVTALDLQYVWWFKNENLYFSRFSGIATKLFGCLIGEWNSCIWDRNTNGAVKATKSTADTVYGTMQSNLVEFTNCNFYYTTNAYAIEWNDAASIQLRYCNLEHNGLGANTTTGSIRFNNSSPGGEGVGLLLDGCWFEMNQGTAVYINNSIGATRHIIDKCIFQYNSSLAYNVYLSGSGSFKNALSISNSKLDGASTADVFATGSNAVVEVQSSSITNPQVASSGTYYVFQPTLVLPGAVDLTTGLLANWDFEETSGNFTDKSGNGKDLTRVNGVTTTTGKINNAAGFASASNQYLTQSGTGLSAGTGFTIVGWFLINSTAASFQIIFEKGASGAGTFEYGMYLNKAGSAVVGEFSPNGTNSTEVTKTISFGVWNFIACTWNGTTASISVNQGTPATAALATMKVGTALLAIGNNPAGTLPFDGKIDQLRIYNRALSTGEIAAYYNNGAGM